MARPRKDEKGCEEATNKWRETMYKKYGGPEGMHKKMQAIGRIGGQNGFGPDYKGGFAGNHEWAVVCGRKGGKISRRGRAMDKTISEAEEILESESHRNGRD